MKIFKKFYPDKIIDLLFDIEILSKEAFIKKYLKYSRPLKIEGDFNNYHVIPYCIILTDEELVNGYVFSKEFKEEILNHIKK